MKRARLIPSILVLILCVAVLTIGVYALKPQAGTISGQISIDPALTPVEITGYIDDKQAYIFDTNNTTKTWALTSSNGFKFDMFYATNINEVPDIQIRITIKNLSETPLGAYFYSGTGNISDNLTDATCVKVDGTIEDSSSNVLADVYMSSYTYIAPNDGQTGGYDEADLYVLVSAKELLRAESSGSLNLDLKIEKYESSSTGTLVKLPVGPSTLSSVPNSSNAQIVVIPTSYTTISSGAFSSTTNLTSIIIPKSVSTITVGELMYCSNIKHITSATQIISAPTSNAAAFSAKSSLKAYFFTGASLTTQFDNITSELKVVLTNNVTSISYAFTNATIIKKLYVPNSVVIPTSEQWLSVSSYVKSVKVNVPGSSLAIDYLFTAVGGRYGPCTTVYIVGETLDIVGGSAGAVTFTSLKNLIFDATINGISLNSGCLVDSLIYTSTTAPNYIYASYGLSTTGTIYVPNSALTNYKNIYINCGSGLADRIVGR